MIALPCCGGECPQITDDSSTCGCACATVTTNCNFVLRKFDFSQKPNITWNEFATDQMKACWASGGATDCYYSFGMGGSANYYFGGGIYVCTGEAFLTVFEYQTVPPDFNTSELVEYTVGTYTVQFTDESIDFDNIGEVDLTDEEAELPNPPCKFSYNFSFTPNDDFEYVAIALPCGPGASSNVNLAPDGRAYFNTYYNETAQRCYITQTTVLAD